MAFHDILVTPLVALVCGILILLVPRLLNYRVAIYLIVTGVAGLLPHFANCPSRATQRRCAPRRDGAAGSFEVLPAMARCRNTPRKRKR